MIQVTGKAISRRALMQKMFTRTRRDVISVEIQITLKVSSYQPRNVNANLIIKVQAPDKPLLPEETSFIQVKKTKDSYVTSRHCL